MINIKLLYPENTPYMLKFPPNLNWTRKAAMEELINIQTLVTAIIVAVPTSMLSVYLALKKYRTEKWWEKKVEWYINAINAMNDIIRFCDSTLAEELEARAVSDDLKKELSSKFHKGKMLLETQTNIGQLLMSREAYNDLLSLDRRFTAVMQDTDFINKFPLSGWRQKNDFPHLYRMRRMTLV